MSTTLNHFSCAQLLSDHLFDPWENEERPPISLKELSNNLNTYERQYHHIRSKSNQHFEKPKIRPHFSSSAIKTVHDK